MKTLHITTAILFLAFAFSCKKALKNVEDYYPKVSTISVIVNPDGSVSASANVSSTGDVPLNYIGFCMDTLPVPNMMSNQQIVDQITGSKYTAVYTMTFDPTKTYYFRSWAVNDHGYSYGNVISLNNIKATPVAAPCNLPQNVSSIGLNGNTSGSVYQVSGVDHFSSTWDITTTGYTSDAGNLTFNFGSALRTKVFTTIAGAAYGDFVSIEVESGSVSGQVSAGSKVYVNEQAPGLYEITVCQASWIPNGYSGSYNLTARFTSPH